MDLGARLISVQHYRSTTTIMDKFQSTTSDRPHNEASENGRFTSQAATAEDLLKAQTVGLVNLNDYRKRRAEALDLKERGMSAPVDSGASTPTEEYDMQTVLS
jgi:protein FAM50